MTRWTTSQLEHFEARRSADGRKTGIVRKSAGRRKPSLSGREPSELQSHMALAGHLRHRAAPGIWWAHYPAGELRDAATAAKLKAMGTKPGVPDFLLLISGRTFGLELKTSIGRLSPEQRTCHAEIEAAGGFCHVAYGLDEALAVLAAWGALKPGAPSPDANSLRQTAAA